MALRLLQELGVTLGYTKEGSTGIITLQYDGKRATLQEGSTRMVIDLGGERKEHNLKAPVQKRSNRTYIPTRDVSEKLGFLVTYNPADKSITITR